MMTEKKYLLSLPRKRMATGVIFLDGKKSVLLVRPNYRDHWLIPGGVVSKNESPLEAGVREVKEEIGLTIKSLAFVSVDYTIPVGVKDESLQFIFYGGVLSSDQIAKIVLQKNEISEYKFVTFAEAEKLVRNKKIHTSFPGRLRESLKILDQGTAVYLEDGQIKK